MSVSLKTKVTAFIALVVIIISMVSTFLFISVHKKSIEREIIARGITMAESLARAVNKGLASENLEFIKQVAGIVHTKDVNLAQVYTTLWQAVDAYPVEKLNDPPDPAAVKHFETGEGSFYKNNGPWFDFYSPIFYKPSDETSDNRNILIGYVRLRLSTEQVRKTIKEAVTANILVSVLITLIAVVVLNAFIRKYVLRPILNLHESVAKYKEGELPETVQVYAEDEIGELSSEFNQMSLALKEREERLAEEKERLAVTLRSIGDAVIVTDIEGTITLINRIAEQHTGWTAYEAVGKQLSMVFNIINEKTREHCGNPVEKVIQTGLITGLANHTALIRKDGTEVIIEDSAAPIRDKKSVTIGVVLVFRDVTEKRRMEEELLKVEKLQSIGLLAGGIAHDFNNVLTSIIGNISMAKMYMETGNKAYERLVGAETASRRAADLTYQLLTFSKGGAPVRKSASIVDTIKESARFILSGANVASEFMISEDIWNVDVDAGQMSQVFNNLIINAVQAMPDGGKIVFTVSNSALSRHEIPTLKEGTYVNISVKDTGTGIPEEYLSRIFDPYFTTKQRGSGLGLASVYSIIKRHDGYITVESKPTRGATFHIYLPASRSRSVSKTSKVDTIAAGQGKILVMDDEELIRDISGKMLSSLGYAVAFAQNGTEAIEMYQKALEAEEPFDVVIMDLTIPGGIGGKEAIQKLRAVDPDVKAIVSSGYSNDPIMADHEKYGFKGVIVKPYSIGSLSKSLSEVIKLCSA